MIVRDAGMPSPFAAGTHLDGDPTVAVDQGEPIDLPANPPAWLGTATSLIRPISIGALIFIPTVGPATVGLVALFSRARAMAMVEASTAFLHGIPSDIVLLIGTLATGYGVAKSVERLKNREAPSR